MHSRRAQETAFYMASSKQKSSLTNILDGVEKGHKAEIQLYTSGHLNHDRLYKPKEAIKCNYWESAKKPALFLRKRTLFTARKEASRRTPTPLASFGDATTPTSTPISAGAKPDSRSSAKPLASKACSAVLEGSLPGFASFKLQRKSVVKEVEQEGDISQKQHIKEELDVPGMKMLKYKPTLNSRLCVMEPTKDEYEFRPSYLAGVTKADQFHSFMQFQKNVIAQEDLLENDYIGSKSAEHHEKKLAQALRNICDCARPHFNRMQAVGDVFEDICNSSLIFGDILKEVKNEYELYLMILLDTLPTMQYRYMISFSMMTQTLQKEVKGMEKRTVKTHEIEEARREIQLLVQKSKCALERNEELRNELEIELYLSQSDSETLEEEESPHSAKEEPHLSSIELLASLRCKILIKWEEIKAMEKEIKDTMVFAGITNIKEKTIKELEAEAGKLKASNKFLKKQIADVEHTITTTLNRQKLSLDSQRFLWNLVKDFLIPEEGDELLENLLGSFFRL
ncbi:hypothetical protein lerEdw1_006189 [Lerista edwardsae]|nr:hypothetical protein lerEdw1_006189 [Lerista edwardsae]